MNENCSVLLRLHLSNGKIIIRVTMGRRVSEPCARLRKFILLFQQFTFYFCIVYVFINIPYEISGDLLSVFCKILGNSLSSSLVRQ